MKELEQAGIHELLWVAAEILESRGLAKGMTCDPETGEVDLEGAVMLACGAKTLSVLVPYPLSIIPDTSAAPYVAIIDLLDKSVEDANITEWSDQPHIITHDAVRLLRKLADQVAIAIV